jgi:hypothetical protein
VPKVQNSPIGGISPNLVTLLESVELGSYVLRLIFHRAGAKAVAPVETIQLKFMVYLCVCMVQLCIHLLKQMSLLAFSLTKQLINHEMGT